MPPASDVLPFLLWARSERPRTVEMMTFRVLGPHERGRFAPEAWGHLLALTGSGALNCGRAGAHHRTGARADRRTHCAGRPPLPDGRRGLRRTRARAIKTRRCTEHGNTKARLEAQSAGRRRTAKAVARRRKRAAKKAKATTKATPPSGRGDAGRRVSEYESRAAAAGGTSTLVIVESPAKAKTIGKYLGRGYRVRATVGHIMDLPEKKLGIDVENGFTPDFVPIPGKEKTIAELKSAAKDASEV